MIPSILKQDQYLNCCRGCAVSETTPDVLTDKGQYDCQIETEWTTDAC